MNHLMFEREFFRLAAIMLACHLRCMGGEIVGIPYGRGPVRFGNGTGELAFQCLGIVDYSWEMRLLCVERLRDFETAA